jgi:hypothetical protein
MMEDINPASEGNRSLVIDNTTDYFYVANFTFGEIEVKLQTQILAHAILPSLKLSTNYINFGACEVSDRKDYMLRIENMNDESPVEFKVASVP